MELINRFDPALNERSEFSKGEEARSAEHVRQRKLMTDDEELIVKDSNGNRLMDGDSVTLIKDLPVKGANVTLKRGTMIKNIRLTYNEDEIECNAEKVKGLVLRTEFLKKA